MVMRRNIALCIILSIVTCGLYSWYWLYCLAEDTNALTGQSNTSGALLIVLSIVTCGIFLWIWMYQAGSAIDTFKTQQGRPSSGSAIAYLLLSIFGLGIISMAILQNELNTYANA